MKLTKLPQDIAELLKKRGMAGKLIYVPKQKSNSLVALHKPKVLMEIEATYEQRGITFYWEASPRNAFSGMFGTNRIMSRFNLKPRTATSVASTAWKAWREWFSRSERLRLEQLRGMAEQNGREYTSLFLSYLEIRGQLRERQMVQIEDYTRYHNVPEETIQKMINLAQSSIESCPWRSS